MAEKKSDEIMAEYLLKGARMLSRCCPTCGSPLFDLKGETRCVVCAETRHEQVPPQEIDQQKEIVRAPVVPEGSDTLAAELASSLIVLCRKVRDEPDPERCLILMEAIGEGIEALRLLSQ
jgi:UPF0148 protein